MPWSTVKPQIDEGPEALCLSLNAEKQLVRSTKEHGERPWQRRAGLMMACPAGEHARLTREPFHQKGRHLDKIKGGTQTGKVVRLRARDERVDRVADLVVEHFELLRAQQRQTSAIVRARTQSRRQVHHQGGRGQVAH